MVSAHDLYEIEAALQRAPWPNVDVGDVGRVDESLVPALAQAVHSSRSAIILTDTQLDEPGPVIRYVNPACERLTGYRSGELVGRNPRLLQGPATDREVLRGLRDDLESGRSSSGQVVNYRADGSPFVISWVVAPVRDEVGEVSAFVAVQEDVTEAWLSEVRNHERLVALQETLVPPAVPVLGHLEVVVLQQPVDDQNKVGGDWSDVVIGPDERVHLVVGDVTGHGVVAALHIGRFRWALQALLRAGVAPAAAVATMSELNEGAPAFASLAIVSVDGDGRRAEVLTAGHPDVMIARPDGVERIRTDDPLLGVSGVEAGPGPAVATLDVGDLICVYSDGVVDERGHGVDEGIERLEKWLANNPAPAGDLEAYVRTMVRSVGGDGNGDDVVVVTARVTEVR